MAAVVLESQALDVKGPRHAYVRARRMPPPRVQASHLKATDQRFAIPRPTWECSSARHEFATVGGGCRRAPQRWTSRSRRRRRRSGRRCSRRCRMRGRSASNPKRGSAHKLLRFRTRGGRWACGAFWADGASWGVYVEVPDMRTARALW